MLSYKKFKLILKSYKKILKKIKVNHVIKKIPNLLMGNWYQYRSNKFTFLNAKNNINKLKCNFKNIRIENKNALSLSIH